jgi:hypothetical protein
MALIYKTTLVPSKLELIEAWVPSQPWYSGGGSESELSRAGGFRLDDPAGEVGIEFVVVSDASGPSPVAYLVPLTYRAAPLAGDEGGLVGTTNHGVLGTRWVYDGAYDPVFVAQVLALLTGDTEAQAQSETETPDPTVLAHLLGPGRFVKESTTSVESGPGGSDIVGVSFVGEATSVSVALHLVRVLHPLADDPFVGSPPIGEVTASWTTSTGDALRGLFVIARKA